MWSHASNVEPASRCCLLSCGAISLWLIEVVLVAPNVAVFSCANEHSDNLKLEVFLTRINLHKQRVQAIE